MIRKIKSKRGQLDYPIITFFVVVFGLILIAPIVLKIFNSIKTPFSNSLGNVTNGGIIAQTNFNSVMNVAVTFWDKVIIAAFVFSVLLLFISAFFIDTSPFWVILYIVLNFFMILFAPDIVGSLGNIYDSQTFANEVNSLWFVNWLRLNFGAVLVGIMVVTGIIIYGKIALFNRGARR